MPKISVLPHPDLCPQGMVVEVEPGRRLIDVLLAMGIEIEHACEMSCCCTTCHVLVRQGFRSMRAASDDEEDQLGRAWGLEDCSRLSCQARVGTEDLVVELPRYSLNLAREHA